MLYFIIIIFFIQVYLQTNQDLAEQLAVQLAEPRPAEPISEQCTTTREAGTCATVVDVLFDVVGDSVVASVDCLLQPIDS